MGFSENYLDNVFPAILAKNSHVTDGKNVKFKIVIRDVGKWMVDMTVTPVQVYRTEEWGDTQLEIDDADFEFIVKNPSRSHVPYNEGRARVKGRTYEWATFYRWLELE